LLCFLVKCIVIVFLGASITGIQNDYTCSVRYEPRLSDKARSSEASRFSITKIWYA